MLEPQERKKMCSIAVSKFKRKRKSALALLKETWDEKVANHIRGPHTCLPHEYVRRLFVGWLVLCGLQFVLGIVLFFGNVLNSARITDTDDAYLFFQTTYHETTHLVIYGESTLLCLSAIGGVALCYFGFPAAHIMIVQAAIFVSFVFTAGTILFSITMQHWPDKISYLKNLEAEAHYRGHNTRFKSLWTVNHFEDNFWDIMQIDLQCCGYRNYLDWLISPCECIPVSCCKNAHFEECQMLFSDPNKRFNDTETIIPIADNIVWNTGCIEKLEEKFSHEKMFWIIFPAFCFCLQFVLLTLHAWITGRIVFYTTSVAGARDQIELFKKKFGVLKNYDALVKRVKELDDPYQIVMHDEPFPKFDIDWKGGRKFVIMSTPDEFTSLEKVTYQAESIVGLHHSVSGMVLVPNRETYVKNSVYCVYDK